MGREAPESLEPGDIVHQQGQTRGRHEGTARYTVGQRRGLKISSDRPLYVTDVDAAKHTITYHPTNRQDQFRNSAVESKR